MRCQGTGRPSAAIFSRASCTRFSPSAGSPASPPGDALDVHRLGHADEQDVGSAAPRALGGASDPLAHALEVHTISSIAGILASMPTAPVGNGPAADARGVSLYRGQRRDRDEAAAVALAIGEKTSGWQAVHSRGFSIRAPSRPRAPRAPSVGAPEIEHPVPGAGRLDPALPARIRASEIRDHRLVDLVAAGTDRRRDGGMEPLGFRAQFLQGSHSRRPGAAHRTPPADVRRSQRPRDGVPENDGQAIGREDRQWRARLGAHEDVGSAGEATPRPSTATPASCTCRAHVARPSSSPASASTGTSSGRNGPPAPTKPPTQDLATRRHMRQPQPTQPRKLEVERGLPPRDQLHRVSYRFPAASPLTGVCRLQTLPGGGRKGARRQARDDRRKGEAPSEP